MAVPIYSAIRNAQHHAGKHVHMMLSVKQSTIALPPSPNLPLALAPTVIDKILSLMKNLAIGQVKRKEEVIVGNIAA